MRIKLFPNKLGETRITSSGHWDVWYPDGIRNYYQTNYYPRGDRYAAKTGQGNTPEAAIANARKIIRPYPA